MKYRVRTGEGELAYESWAQLQEAAALGFVEGDDEVQREDQAEWRKASTMAGLMKAAARPKAWSTALFRWVLLSVLGAGFAGWAIHKGTAEDKPELYALGLAAGFVVAGVLFKVTSDAARRKR